MSGITPEVVKANLLPQLEGQAQRNRKIEGFIKLEDNLIAIPERSTLDHRRLAEFAKSPWAKKIVDSRVHRLRTIGIRDSTGSDDDAWAQWKKWRMARKEKTILREAISYGDAYVELRLMPGGDTLPFPKSPFNFTAFYEEDSFGDAFNSEFPVLAMERADDGTIKVWDDKDIIIYNLNKEGSIYEASRTPHGFDVVPVVRYANDMDSHGCSYGDIWSLRHVLMRIMKATYDSGVINHSNSWNIRWITGLDNIVDGLTQFDEETDEEFARRQGAVDRNREVELAASDMMTLENPNARIGSLPATPPGQFIPVIEQALKELAALSNTPSEFLTGDVVAQSAEQAGNSQKTYNRMIDEKRAVFGEAHESLLRLHYRRLGNTDFSSTIVWDGDEGESIAAKVDALGKIATMLKVPETELWEDLPGMTPEKLERYRNAWKLQKEEEQSALNAVMAMGNEEESAAMRTMDRELEE